MFFLLFFLFSLFVFLSLLKHEGKSPKGDVEFKIFGFLCFLTIFVLMKSCYIILDAITSLFRLLSVRVIFGFIIIQIQKLI